MLFNNNGKQRKKDKQVRGQTSIEDKFKEILKIWKMNVCKANQTRVGTEQL